MDIVGAINHNLNAAGVKSRSRIKNGVCEVQLLVPTKPKPTILTARMPVSEFAQQVGYDGHVGGKVAKKIKKGVKAVVKNKVVKALVKGATGLAKTMVPGAGLALKSAAALTKTAKKLSKKAKAGDPKAAKLLKAPLKLAVVKPGAKPKGLPLVNAQPVRAKPAPKPVARALPPPQEPDESEPESDGAEESADEQEAAELTSSEDEEEEIGAGAYLVTTPAGRKGRVTLP
jgi:hypothetical protein